MGLVQTNRDNPETGSENETGKVAGVSKPDLYMIDTDYRVQYVNATRGQPRGEAGRQPCYQSIMDRQDICPGCKAFAALTSKSIMEGTVTGAEESTRVNLSFIPFRDERGNWLCTVINNGGAQWQPAPIQISDPTRQSPQAQKMEALGTLAGGIAHDLNNILMAITGYTEMALDDVPDDSESYAHMSQVLQAACWASDLVKQILLFCRQTETEHKPLRVTMLVQETLKLLKASLPSTIAVRHSSSAQSDLVMADPTQIYQVMINLCTNAAQAMQEQGGLLEVRLENATVSNANRAEYPDAAPGRYLKLLVRDTGTGIDSRIAEHIFEPFFTTKEKRRGTGLGLAVTHGIISNHKGFISVSSTPGRGTCFTVLLPVITGVSAPPG